LSFQVGGVCNCLLGVEEVPRRARPPGRRRGSVAAPPPTTSPSCPMVYHCFDVPPPPIVPLFIASPGGKPSPQHETATVKNGSKRSGGKILVGTSGRKAAVSLARGASVSDWCCREVPALPIGSCRVGTGTGASTHLLGSPPRRRDFGTVGAGRFLDPSPNSAPDAFWEAFWGRQWRCSKIRCSVFTRNSFLVSSKLEIALSNLCLFFAPLSSYTLSWATKWHS
jgi:hypothetical protein